MSTPGATIVGGMAVSGGRHGTPVAAAWRRLVASPVARAGLVIVSIFVVIALVTPAVHDYDAKTDADLSLRLRTPTAAHRR